MKTSRRPFLPVVYTAFATLTACSPAPDSENVAAGGNTALGPGQVATVNGEPVAESLFRFYVMSALQKNPDALTPQERQAAIEDLVQLEILADEAAERGLLNERAVAAELELQRLQGIARAMAMRHIQENPPTDADLQALYDQNLSRLAPTEYKARHILLPTEDEASAVIEELQDGADFIALAEARADGPTGPNGGDLGWFSPASMVPAIAQAVETMEVGSFSPAPIQTEYGYHVVLLEETRASEAPPLDSGRNDLRSAAERQKLQEFIGSLRTSAEVEILP